jgi:hypothetical protein
VVKKSSEPQKDIDDLINNVRSDVLCMACVSAGEEWFSNVRNKVVVSEFKYGDDYD